MLDDIFGARCDNRITCFHLFFIFSFFFFQTFFSLPIIRKLVIRNNHQICVVASEMIFFLFPCLFVYLWWCSSMMWKSIENCRRAPVKLLISPLVFSWWKKKKTAAAWWVKATLVPFSISIVAGSTGGNTIEEEKTTTTMNSSSFSAKAKQVRSCFGL